MNYNSLFSAVFCAIFVFMQSCVGGGHSYEEFTQTVYLPTHASGFRVLKVPGAESTLLEVVNPWQGADSVKRYVFIARGGEVPPPGALSVNASHSPRVVCMSTSQIGLLSAFGADSLVVGVSGIDYVTDSLIVAHRNQIADVGFDGSVDYERLLSVRPDLVLLYGVGGASPMEEKLNELGIPYAYIGEYLEQSPLGRAEWMVALGELVGRRAEAEAAFVPVANAYDSLRNLADSIACHPGVMLNAPYSDVWFMPPVSSYMVRLIADAGGRYLYPENQSGVSQPIDIEVAATLVGNADVWLQPGQAHDLAQLRQMVPKLSVKCPVFNSSPDFWESGVARPDLVLSDLMNIMSGAKDSDSIMTYFRELK